MSVSSQIFLFVPPAPGRNFRPRVVETAPSALPPSAALLGGRLMFERLVLIANWASTIVGSGPTSVLLAGLLDSEAAL